MDEALKRFSRRKTPNPNIEINNTNVYYIHVGYTGPLSDRTVPNVAQGLFSALKIILLI